MSNIIALWQNLLDYDKQKLVFAARCQSSLHTGRFRSPKKKQEFTPGVESPKRHALTTTAPLAQWPDCSRLIEAIFTRLCEIHRSPKKKGTATVSRWDLILEDYRRIRRRILANGTIMAQTSLQLVDVSQTTLVQWHNKKVKRDENAVVMQGLSLPSRLSMAFDPLLPAIVRPPSAPPQPGPLHQYHLPTSTVGQAKRKRTILPAAATTLAAVRLSPQQQQQHPRQLFPAPPSGPQLLVMQQPFPAPPSGPQVLVRLAPPQLPMLVTAPQVLSVNLYSAPPAPPAPVPRKVTRTVLHNTCKKCGQFRTAETGHSQYKGVVYCPSVETVPKEQWLKNMKKKQTTRGRTLG